MRIKRFINVHTILILVFLLTIGGIAYRFTHWGQKVDINDITPGDQEYQTETLDLFLPLVDKEGNEIKKKLDKPTIVCFGNAPFADDRDSEDNLANMIAKRTGGTVYNCSVTDSFLAAVNYTIDANKYPWDAFNFYWLVQLGMKSPLYANCDRAMNQLGDDCPKEAREVYDTLWNLDFSEVDVITIMYDASDYLASHEMYNSDNPTDIEQFTGNLEAGIEVIQEKYPEIRIIVMSPTYAFAVDSKGNYVSSDQYRYGWDVLSTYSIKEHESCLDRSVSFVDHLYGTINEDNAKEYLIDNLHLNKAGRELVADRFMEALNYYD